MVKGPAGYGRYDDDPQHIGCPWAKSDMTPCIARDGRLALIGNPPARCFGCAHTPEYLIDDLAGAYEPARALLVSGDLIALADEFAIAVREATEPGKGAP